MSERHTMSNAELVAAIAEAWKLTRITGIGEKAYPILVEHLRILLETQQARAMQRLPPLSEQVADLEHRHAHAVKFGGEVNAALRKELAMMIRERDALFGRTPAAFNEWLEEYAADYPHSERQGVRDALHNAWIAGHNYALKQVTPAQNGDKQ